MSDNGDVALICGTIGVILTFLGGAVILNTRDFRRRALRGWGQVVRLRTSQTGVSERERRSNAIYHPILRFTTADGQTVEAESPVGSNPPPARPGERVAIMYDPGDPAQVRIDSPMGSGTLVGAVSMGVGLLLLVIGVRLGIPFLMGDLFPA